MRVIFLDIDGVLNSVKTCVATGGYPMKLTERERFDWMAIRLLQRLCDSSGVQIVLSSAWRLHNEYKAVAEAFELPIIDRTPSLLGCRGDEIKHWLDNHVEVTHYVIIDDDPDMLPQQKPYFIQTDGFEGFTWANYVRLCEMFGEPPYAGETRARTWQGEKLDWKDAQ